MNMIRQGFAAIGMLSGFLLPQLAHADGMVPETSVVIVNEADGEATIRVTNTDAQVALLHVALENIPEDDENLLLVTPPVSRVEPGAQQLVRFILRNEQPLLTQRLKRVTFEGIPARQDAAPGAARVAMGVRQNMPVILHPRGLERNREPWKGLEWSLSGNTLRAKNDTPYVVRLGPGVQLLPTGNTANLPRPYILPGQHLELPVEGDTAGAVSVRLEPATVYGAAVDDYIAPLVSAGQ